MSEEPTKKTHAPDRNGILRHRGSHKGYKQKPIVGWYELAHKIHRESGVQLYIVREIVSQFMDEISGTLVKGKSVKLRNLCSFSVVLRDARQAQDPYIPGSRFVLPPRAGIRTRISKNLKLRVQELTPMLARKSHQKMDSTPEHPIQ